MKKGLLIPADIAEPLRLIDIPDENGGDELAAMQAAVGGYIQIVPNDLGSRVSVFVDEEGKLKGGRSNPRANYLVRTTMRGLDYIAGDALVMGPVDAKGDTLGVPEFLLKATGLA